MLQYSSREADVLVVDHVAGDYEPIQDYAGTVIPVRLVRSYLTLCRRGSRHASGYSTLLDTTVLSSDDVRS